MDSVAGRCVPRCSYFADALFGPLGKCGRFFGIFCRKDRFVFCAEICADDFYSAADFCAIDAVCALGFALFCAYAPCVRAYVVRLLKCLRRSSARDLFPARSLGLLPLFSSTKGAYLRLYCSATMRLYLCFCVNAPMTCFAVKQRCLGSVLCKIELTFARMICCCAHSRRFCARVHIFSLFFRVFVVILAVLGWFYEILDVVGDLSRFGGRNH